MSMSPNRMMAYAKVNGTRISGMTPKIHEALGVEEGREEHRQDHERHHAEQRAQEDDPGAPALPLIGQVAGTHSQSPQAEHHGTHHDPPVGRRSAGDQVQLHTPPAAPRHGRHVDRRWHQVDRHQLAVALGQPRHGVGDGIRTPLPDLSGEDQEEMQESGRQQEQGHGPGGEHERVHPGVRRRPQPTHQEQHEQGAHGEEHPRSRHTGLLHQHEESHAEEDEAQHRGIEVRGIADLAPAELDVDFHHVPHRTAEPTRTDQVGNDIADAVPIEDLLGMSGGLEDGPIDPDDEVTGVDAGLRSTGSRNHGPHPAGSGAVTLQHDPVVRFGQKHVDDRQPGHQERKDPRDQKGQSLPPSSIHLHHHTQQSTGLFADPAFSADCSGRRLRTRI
jgi:hypothetical protein